MKKKYEKSKIPVDGKIGKAHCRPMSKNQVEQASKAATEILTFKLARKASTNEWVVRVYSDGKLDEARTYYTDDKEDAQGTLAMMEAQAAATPVDLDALVAKHTGFSTMAEMVEAKGGYFPTIYVKNPALRRIADSYDAIQAFRGDSRRAYRVNA